MSVPTSFFVLASFDFCFDFLLFCIMLKNGVFHIKWALTPVALSQGCLGHKVLRTECVELLTPLQIQKENEGLDASTTSV